MINMFGNKKFQKLVEILQREEKLFPIDFPNHFGTKWIKPLREKILEERGRGSTETIDFFEEHFNNLEVKGLLRLKGVYYIPEDTPKSLVPEGQNFEVIGVLLPNEQGRDKKTATYRALLRK